MYVGPAVEEQPHGRLAALEGGKVEGLPTLAGTCGVDVGAAAEQELQHTVAPPPLAARCRAIVLSGFSEVALMLAPRSSKSRATPSLSKRAAMWRAA